MTRYGCKLVLPSPGVKYKCGEIRVLFALEALVFLTANGREATRRERWYSFSLREKVAEGRMRVKTLGCYFVKVMRSPSPRPSPVGEGVGNIVLRHSLFGVRYWLSVDPWLNYWRTGGASSTSPQIKNKMGQGGTCPPAFFWRAPKTKKRPSRLGGSLKECGWITSRAGT